MHLPYMLDARAAAGRASPKWSCPSLGRAELAMGIRILIEGDDPTMRLGRLSAGKGEEKRQPRQPKASLASCILVISHEGCGLAGHPDQKPQTFIHHWGRTGDKADRALIAAGHLAAHHVRHHAACQANAW